MNAPHHGSRHKTWRLNSPPRGGSSRSRGNREHVVEEASGNDPAQPWYSIHIEQDASGTIVALVDTMERARGVMGHDRYHQACQCFDRSDQLAYNACVEAAEGLVALTVPKKKVIDSPQGRWKWQLITLAKQAAMRLLFFRVAGWKSGLDSESSLDTHFLA